MSRLLAIDLGARRIGLAVGDADSGEARGLGVLRRRSLDEDAAALGRLTAEQGIEGLVVGLPRNTDGTEGPQAAATLEWGAALAAKLGLPLSWRDERWTSQLAEANLGRVRRGRSGGPPSRSALAKRRAAVDQEAARLILQAELDARAQIPAGRSADGRAELGSERGSDA